MEQQIHDTLKRWAMYPAVGRHELTQLIAERDHYKQMADDYMHDAMKIMNDAERQQLKSPPNPQHN